MSPLKSNCFQSLLQGPRFLQRMVPSVIVQKDHHQEGDHENKRAASHGGETPLTVSRLGIKQQETKPSDEIATKAGGTLWHHSTEPPDVMLRLEPNPRLDRRHQRNSTALYHSLPARSNTVEVTSQEVKNRPGWKRTQGALLHASSWIFMW